jgi:hypothetical protein
LAPWAEQQQKKQSILFVVALTNKPRKVQLAAMGCLWHNISDNKNSYYLCLPWFIMGNTTTKRNVVALSIQPSLSSSVCPKPAF